jgi:hypothetical protein
MEKRTMLLTKQKLNTILENLRISIPDELQEELLERYGNMAVTDDGRVIEYSEQDIAEQLRKILRPINKEVKTLS